MPKRSSRPIRLTLLALLSILLFAGLNTIFVALRLGPLSRLTSFMGHASRLSADAAGKEFLPLSDSLVAWDDLFIWPFEAGSCCRSLRSSDSESALLGLPLARRAGGVDRGVAESHAHVHRVPRVFRLASGGLLVHASTSAAARRRRLGRRVSAVLASGRPGSSLCRMPCRLLRSLAPGRPAGAAGAGDHAGVTSIDPAPSIRGGPRPSWHCAGEGGLLIPSLEHIDRASALLQRITEHPGDLASRVAASAHRVTDEAVFRVESAA